MKTIKLMTNAINLMDRALEMIFIKEMIYLIKTNQKMNKT